MKKLWVFLAILLLAVKFSTAQCDKKTVLKSEKQEMLDKDGKVLETKDDILTIEFQKDKIMVTNEGQPNPVNATVKESTCDWAEPFKNGKSFYKVEFNMPDGQIQPGTLELSAKEGVVSLYVTMERFGDRKIRVLPTRFDEVKP